MTTTQDQFDDLLGRAALAALFYYPEIVVEDEAYDLQADVTFCLEALEGIDVDDDARAELRMLVGLVITNPTAHRHDLVDFTIELAPPQADD
ncbi:hypothetical protein [Agromyces seonyuensis]|uniref:Uncharacterized protein n=1 Tax=Agromyces seonyuensis TaxID=2662446 RepID=A0A6I4P4Y2_9MICO|nr:hypothetical protein [Agromyces seonyuensis]MWB99429.1 hypothetical protein [Agromyces seonyuensis]